MSLTCTLTGRVPFEPVVLTKTGYLFEKSELYAAMNQKFNQIQTNSNSGPSLRCPVSHCTILDNADECLEMMSSIEMFTILGEKNGLLRVVKKNPNQIGGSSNAINVRTVPTSNLPGIFSLLQQTYNDMMSVIFKQKKDLSACKEQLSHVLLQQDAATRTIKRILQERDQAIQTTDDLRLAAQEQRSNPAFVAALTMIQNGGSYEENLNVANLTNQNGSSTASVSLTKIPSPKNKSNTGTSNTNGPTASSSDPSTLLHQIGQFAGVEEVGFSKDWVQRLTEYDLSFVKQRKEGSYRALHKSLTPFSTNVNMEKLYRFSNRHQSTAPGILCCSLSPREGSGEILTGGVDGNLEIFNMYDGMGMDNDTTSNTNSSSTGKSQTIEVNNNSITTKYKLSSHEGAVVACQFHPSQSNSLLISGSRDGTVKIWRKSSQDMNWKPSFTSGYHSSNSEITTALIHPVENLLLSTSKSSSNGSGSSLFCYLDMTTQKLLRKLQISSTDNSIEGIDHITNPYISNLCVHPNGKAGIASIGNKITLWDLIEGKCQKTITHDEDSKNSDSTITALAVSANAVNIVSGSKNGVINLWDLRKQDSGPIQTWKIESKYKSSSSDPDASKYVSINRLRFDPVGQYLGIATSEKCHIYHFESKTQLVETVSNGHYDSNYDNTVETFKNGPPFAFTDVHFGHRAGFAVGVGMGRSVNFFQAPSLRGYFLEEGGSVPAENLKRQKVG